MFCGLPAAFSVRLHLSLRCLVPKPWMGSDLSVIAQYWSMACTELDSRFQIFFLDPRFQIFQSVSVATVCFCQSLHNYHFREVQSQPATVMNITELFRVSGLGQSSGSPGEGLAYRAPSDDRPMGKQHLEPLANEVRKFFELCFPLVQDQIDQEMDKGICLELED